MSHVGKSTMIQTSSRTIYTAGRPPWYDSEGTIKDAFIIGICGGSASGKTTVAKNIIEALDVPWVALLSMDSFYNVFNEEQRELAAKNDFNFDHPDAFDIKLVVETLRKLKEGKQVSIPIYNFHTHSREKQQKAIYGANVIIFEGIMAFAHKSLLELMDMKIFVDTDSDIRLARRLRRDTVERGRDIHGVLQQYERFVKPAFEHYIEPTMMHADIIIPRGGENAVACRLVVQHVHTQLTNRGFQLRQQLRSCHAGQPLPSNFFQLESTPQIKGLHTIIRNRETPRDEFVFYSARLMRLLVEYALSFLPHETIEVETPQGINYIGQRVEHMKSICGVSILRAGEVMEPALTSICKDVRLGKILIQTNLRTGEPELYYLRLPREIDQGWVFLMEATVATGAAAMMAIRVLLDHDVKEDRIVLLSLLMAESGIHAIAYAFPKVKILTTAYDPEIDEQFHIIPGIGNFGDRYFGTDE